jgi:hypothetical protein
MAKEAPGKKRDERSGQNVQSGAEGGSLDRRDNEQGSDAPEQPPVQQPPIRGQYASAGQGSYKPSSREGGEWRDNSQAQTSRQPSGSGNTAGPMLRDTSHAGSQPTNVNNPPPGQPAGTPATPDPGPGPHGSSDPETDDRNKNKPLMDDWGKGDKH